MISSKLRRFPGYFKLRGETINSVVVVKLTKTQISTDVCELLLFQPIYR